MRSRIKESDRIVIKVGTSTLAYDNGRMNLASIEKLVRKISDLSNRGKEIILVSSGAVGIGMGRLGMTERPELITEKQAAAAVGQSELMHLYSKLFSEYGIVTGQILLTREVFTNEMMRKNARNTFMSLLERKVIPVVNENDSVSTAELEFDAKHSFSENDTLAAMVAIMTGSDLLIILSDQDGFFTGDPRKDEKARVLETITEINDEIEKYAGGNGTAGGTGGMVTKLNAAKLCMEKNIGMVVANGGDMDNIAGIIEGKTIGTFFIRSMK